MDSQDSVNGVASQSQATLQNIFSSAPEANQSGLPENEIQRQSFEPNSDINDFKIEAFSILKSASDYNSGINDLKDYYTKNKLSGSDATQVLADSGNNLRYKFEESGLDPSSLLQALPIKPKDVIGKDNLETINNWEQANTKAITESKDIDQIAASKMLLQNLSNTASEMRRDVLAGGPISDKFYRFAEGFVGPFADLLGYDSVDKYLHERTAPESDKGLAGEIASIAGGVVPIIAGSLTGQPEIAVPAILGAQALGTSKELYKTSLEETGNQNRAEAGAALSFGAQALVIGAGGKALAPIADIITERLLQGTTKEAAAKIISSATKGGEEAITSTASATTGTTLLDSMIGSLQKQKSTLGTIGTSAIEAGTIGSAGQVIGNIANNIALNKDGDISEGIGNNFLAMAALAGVGGGAHALLNNAILEENINLLRRAKDSFTGKTAPEGVSNPSIKAAQDSSAFKLNEDGYIEQEPSPDASVETRRRAATNIINDGELYTHTTPEESNGKFTDESGNIVTIPTAPDVEVLEAPKGTLIYRAGFEPSEALNTEVEPNNIANLGKSAPARFISYIAGKLGANLQLARNISDGALGSFNEGTGTIKLLRSIGAAPLQLRVTLAHEFGHFIDDYISKDVEGSPELKSMFKGMKGLSDLIKDLGPEAPEDTKNISMDWRLGWDGSQGDIKSPDPIQRFNAYRNDPAEQYADLVSAILNVPDSIRKNYPNIYNSFEKQLSKDPNLNSFWNQLRDFESNPDKISEFNLVLSKSSREKQGTIAAADRLKDIQQNSLWSRLKRSSNDAFQFLFQRLGGERIAAGKIGDPEKRNAAFEQLDQVEKYTYLGQFLKRTFAAPTKAWLFKFNQSGLNPNDLAHYLWANRVINETTKTINNIHENFDVYKEAGKAIQDFLSKQKGVKESVLNGIFNDIDTPDKLSRAFSQLGIVGDTAQILNLNDFLQKEDPSNPDAKKNAIGNYNRAVAALNRRSESIPIKALKDYAEKLNKKGDKSGLSSEVKKAIQDITQDNAFAVRKYLINSGGYGELDASRDIAFLQKKLGNTDFQKLKVFGDSFHAIMNGGNDLIRRSGLFSPELLERIGLNKDNYVMANVLRHFEGDDSIDATVKSAVGSLSETGNEIVSTYIKENKIAARAYKQMAINAAINLADTNGHTVEKISKEYGRNLFDQKRALSAGDKDHSYLVGYKEGIPTLYKIDGGKTYEKMFESVASHPALAPLLHISDAFNNLLLTRTLKTAFSPAFVLFNKFYDRRKEALLANSLEITLGLPLHTSPLLRSIDRSTRDSINHYLETRKETGVGELIGPLQDVISHDAALLQLHEIQEFGLHAGTSVADSLYEMFGEKMPDEKNILEKIGNYTEKALGRVGGDWLNSITDFDHLRTKVNGFQIGKKVFGMPDSEAAVFAREKFGVPDTLGGGVGAPLINRMFLFGRAHLNEIRTLAGFMKDNPKIAATQMAYRIVLPKALMLSAIAVPAMRQIMGDESADIYDHFLQMVPEFEKISKNIIPLGFQDGRGGYHNIWDVQATDIKPDWKAWYIRMPQAREITTLTKFFWPMVKYGIEGQFGKAIGGGALGLGSEFASSVQPSIQYLTNIGQLSMGFNPTDFYRMKGIFKNDLQEGGSFGEKLENYGRYFLGQQYPLSGAYRPFNPDTPQTLGEQIQATPFVGPLARTLTGVSNYGLYETSKEGEALRIAEDAQLKRSTDDSTQKLLDIHRRVSGTVKAEGGKKGKELERDVRMESNIVNSWETRVWIPMREELRQAKDKNDAERYQYILRQLKVSSERVLPRIESLQNNE